ncbi:MAG: protein translocase subunit SecF [Candidatus Eisenbacteria bacterium]|uniref:Protein-export membrane protein SecF n=1 Tax=Eiseniibacteriota bacterium TaxID=2212470 RepID=A0A956RRL5_UNCEI|nr:protein translocase subunit SecF [Candidatus Eisenbacteria bacterium]
MFEIIRETHVPFMAIRRRAYIFSIALIAVGIVSYFVHGGFRLGVDFSGGRLIEYKFNESVDPGTIRNTLTKIGIQGGEVQEVGREHTSFIVRVPVSDTEAAAADKGPSALLLDALQKEKPGLSGELLREELVGPRVGSELRQKAFWAVLISLVLILAYVGFRFEIRFAVGGVIALAHDVLVVLALFSVLNIEITIPVVAALLTIGGYSINDTVVVFDRIREQSRLHVGQKISDVMDLSINQTLSRTIITAFTTFLAALSLVIFGGEVIHDFALAMVVGVAIGTYSSIFVASALALDMSKHERIQAPR